MSPRCSVPLFLLSQLLFLIPLPAQEFRALWVDAFNVGFKTPAEVTTLVNTARAGKFNAIIPQVRKRGDAYYRGGLEPLASDITSSTFDPLADLVAKAHDTSGGGQRLEVHAWMVTYNIWNQEFGIPPQPSHPFRSRPEWLSEKYRADPADPAQPVVRWDGVNYMLDQGHPAVQQHTYGVAMDILSRYDVDGIHFDYIRYSDDSSANNNPWGYHPVSVARFNRLRNRTGIPLPTDAAWLQWRRDQVTAMLRKVYLNAWAIKPQTRITAALITYGNVAPTSAANFPTQAEAYRRVLQDWGGWLQEGILDLACPMVYKTSDAGVTSWVDFIRRNQFRRAAAIGLGSYLNPMAQNIGQMKIARTAASTGEKAVGIVGYSYTGVDNSSTTTAGRLAARNEFMAALTVERTPDIDPAAAPLFATEAALPSMPWKTDLTRGQLMGFVTSAADASVLDGATFTLVGPVTRSFVSDGTGFYGSVDLPVGNYTLTVSSPGFGSQVRPVSITGAAVRQAAFALGPPVLDWRNYAYNPATRRANLTWTSEVGQTFRIEFSDDLETWTAHVSGYPSGGLSTSYQTPAAAAGTMRRFWRVRRE